MEKPEHTSNCCHAWCRTHKRALDHQHCQIKATHGQLPPLVATGWLVALTHGPLLHLSLGSWNLLLTVPRTRRGPHPQSPLAPALLIHICLVPL